MRKKRALSLLEIIIVIFLITLITGAVGYNMKGSLDKGRIFRTEQAIEQLKDLFLICQAEGDSPDEITKDPVKALKKWGLAKNPEKIVEDGWGQRFDITYARSKKEFQIVSRNLIAHQKKGASSHISHQDSSDDISDMDQE